MKKHWIHAIGLAAFALALGGPTCRNDQGDVVPIPLACVQLSTKVEYFGTFPFSETRSGCENDPLSIDAEFTESFGPSDLSIHGSAVFGTHSVIYDHELTVTGPDLPVAVTFDSSGDFDFLVPIPADGSPRANVYFDVRSDPTADVLSTPVLLLVASGGGSFAELDPNGVQVLALDAGAQYTLTVRLKSRVGASGENADDLWVTVTARASELD
jgi:hypothetical protein